MITIGLDPGARFTGVSVRDIGEDSILLSSTYVKPAETEIVFWAVHVSELIQVEVVDLFPTALIGIEGLAAPRGYNNGKLAPLNPKYLIFAGIVLGALAQRFNTAVIVPPGHNGTGRAGYPDVLNGRRPASLPGSAKGAGTRNHEKSAYDVAGEVPFLVANNYRLDSKTEL